MIELRNLEKSVQGSSSPAHASCPPTSRRATCIRKRAKKIMRLFRRIDEQGTTIVPVTHSRDGWLERS